MATVHRCDICRDESSSEAKALTTVVGRMNLEKVAAGQPNYVQVTIDLCAKPECRKLGLSQITEELFVRSVELAGLASTKVVSRREVTR